MYVTPELKNKIFKRLNRKATPKTTNTKRAGYNVKIIFGISGCGQCIGSIDVALCVVGVISGWGQCMWSLGVVSRWWMHLNRAYLLFLYLFLAASSLLFIQFCIIYLCFILVFVTFLHFSNLIRERISMEQVDHSYLLSLQTEIY